MIGTVFAIGALIADSGLGLHAVRFYRADPGQSPGQTQVTAFIEIPPDLSAEPDVYLGHEGVRRYFAGFDGS